ncbi:MAG: hypothetical protein RLO48_18895 [Bauldia litoralis]
MEPRNQVAGNTNSYHSYSLNEALEDIAGAGFRYVELSALRGWTEHVPLGARNVFQQFGGGMMALFGALPFVAGGAWCAWRLANESTLA